MTPQEMKNKKINTVDEILVAFAKKYHCAERFSLEDFRERELAIAKQELKKLI
jgi:hypothetical protein